MSETSDNNKRIAKNTLFLYFRMLLLMAVSLYTGRVMLRSLGEVDYGLNNVIYGVIAMFAYLNNTLATSTSRFITFGLGKNDIEKVGAFFNNSFGIHFCYAIILFVVLETGGTWFVNNVLNIPEDRMFACNIVFQVTIFSSFLQIIRVPFNALIIAHERMNIFAYLGIYDAVMKCLVAIAISHSSFDRFILMALLLLVNEVIVYVMYWVYCRRQFSDVCRLSKHYSKEIIRSMLGFTTWSLFGSTAMMARNHGITILINLFFGATVNAANAIAYRVNTAITNFTNNFTIALNPQITKTYAAGENEAMKKLIFRGSRFSFYLLLLLCYPVLFETDYLLGLWLGDYPNYSATFTQWVLVLSMVEIFNNSVGCAVQATGNIKWYQIVIGSIQLLTFPVAYLLYSFGMPPYAALMTMVALGIIAILVRLYFIKHLLKISPIEYLTGVLLKCGLIAALAVIVPAFLVYQMEDSLVRFLSIAVCCTLSTTIIIFLLGVSKSERVFLKNVVLKVLRRK